MRSERVVRESWLAGNLAQLDEMQSELEHSSPGGSPTRRSIQKGHSPLVMQSADAAQCGSLPHVPEEAACSASQADSIVGSGMAAAQPRLHAIRVVGGHEGNGMGTARWLDIEAGPASDAAAELQRTSAPATTVDEHPNSLQAVTTARKEARRRCLQERAELRASRIKEKHAAERQHMTTVRSAKPRLKREDLQQMGQQFAERGKQVVDSKSSEQLAHAPAFVVPVPKTIGTQPAESKSASTAKCGKQQASGSPSTGQWQCRRTGSRSLWTAEGLQDSAELHAQQPRRHDCDKASGVKPWKSRSVPAAISDKVGVQIFVPTSRPAPQAAKSHESAPPVEAAHDDGPDANGTINEVLVFSPPQRATCMRHITEAVRACTPPDLAAHDQCSSPLEEQQAALSDLQTFLDADSASTGQEQHDAGHMSTVQMSGSTAQSVQSGGGRSEGVSDKREVPKGALGATAVKIEELRMWLEAQLGADTLLSAYQYVQQLEAREQGKEVQAKLEQLLHPHEHLAYSIYKLVTLEEVCFGDFAS